MRDGGCAFRGLGLAGSPPGLGPGRKSDLKPKFSLPKGRFWVEHEETISLNIIRAVAQNSNESNPNTQHFYAVKPQQVEVRDWGAGEHEEGGPPDFLLPAFPSEIHLHPRRITVYPGEAIKEGLTSYTYLHFWLFPESKVLLIVEPRPIFNFPDNGNETVSGSIVFTEMERDWE